MPTIVLNDRDNLFYDTSSDPATRSNLIFGDSGGALAGGNDIIFGLRGADRIFGDTRRIEGDGIGGNDQLFGGDGNDRLVGDARFITDGARGGADLLVQGGGRGVLFGDAQQLQSGATGGNDHVRGAGLLYGDAGRITDAFGGNDVVDASWVTRQGINSLFGDGDLAGSSLGGRDVLTGSDFRDQLYGEGILMWGGARGAGDVIDGGGGNDFIFGDADVVDGDARGGNDNLRGGTGNDRIVGDFQAATSGAPAGGSDTIWGGAGNDRLTGDVYEWDGLEDRPGDDSFMFQGAFGNDVITDFGRGDDRLVFRGIDPWELEIEDDGADTIATVVGSGTVRLLDYEGGLVAGDSLFVG